MYILPRAVSSVGAALAALPLVLGAPVTPGLAPQAAAAQDQTTLASPQPLPTAFVCNNDQVAMRLVAQLEAMGVRVPQDISVTGFDNFIYATLCVPALTTYTVDQERMAQVAIRRLQSRIRDGAEGPIRTIVGGWVVERESTCARAEKQA